MHEAIAVICGGETDFVYTLNAATGMVLASRSFTLSDHVIWTHEEKAVMQVVQPPFDRYYWPDDVMETRRVLHQTQQT